MEMEELKELKAKRDVLRDELAEVFAEAKVDGGYNFRQVKSLPDIDKLDGYEKSVRVAEIVKEKTAELNDLCQKIEMLEAAAKAAGEFDALDHTPVNKPVFPGAAKEKPKSVGKMVTEHKTFQAWRAGSKEGRIEFDMTYKELKALLTSSTGFPPESTRTGTLVEMMLRPLQIMDIMPRGQTGQQNVVWMAQTVRTQAAAETAEGAAKPEAAFAFEERSTPVREISVYLPVTDIQLEDVPLVESLVETQLREDMEERLDKEIVVGNGTPPNLLGILNTSGILTQARGADPVFDAILKAGTVIRTGSARAVPTHVLLHPSDWQTMRLTRTADGIYILGNPQDTGVPRIWGWPVVENEALSAGTGLVGSFTGRNIMLVERRGIVMERGWVNAQFRENQQSIRASMRAALAVFRPAAFATVTGLAA